MPSSFCIPLPESVVPNYARVADFIMASTCSWDEAKSCHILCDSDIESILAISLSFRNPCDTML